MRSLNVLKWRRYAGSLRFLYDTAPFTPRCSYDIIQCHFGTNGERAARLRAIGAIGGKLVTMFHGFDIRLALTQGPQIYRCLMDAGDCFLSISAYNRENLLRFGFDPKRIVDHPVGVDMRRFPRDRWIEDAGTSSQTTAVRILTVARLIPEKALHFGIEACHKVLGRHPELPISDRIVGEGPCRPELEDLIRKHGLTDIVTLSGAQDESGVRQELARADIFLLPSVSEALPVALMEAQASGLPAVASAVGSVDSIVRDGVSGYLASPGDVEGIAQRLSDLIAHPDKRRTMGRAGRSTWRPTTT